MDDLPHPIFRTETLNIDIEKIKETKVPIKGGGVCIYCGWDGGKEGLRDEHIVPFSLGGNVQLAKASCSRCESITSYIDGYLTNAVFGHFRVHANLPSRSGHKATLTATIELESGVRVIDLATKDHPYFLNMPIWRYPGILRGALPSEGFGSLDIHKYWYLPENIRQTLGMADGEIAKVIDTAPLPNFPTFARGLAKIAYCDAVRRYGLDGFRPLAIPDIILGKYTDIAHFVGSERRDPSPPYPPGVPHSVTGGTAIYQRIKLLTSTIRLFGNSGAGEHGMPFYMVVVGATGSRRVTPKQPSRAPPRSIEL